MPRKPRLGEGMFNGLIIDSRPFMARMEYDFYEKVDQQTISAKISLSAGLNRYPQTWLVPTLKLYRIANRGVKRDKVQALVESITDVALLAPRVQALSPDEQAILSMVLAHDGIIKYQNVSRKYGNEEEDGYFWESSPPTSPIGRLRLHGLLFVGRMQIGQRREKMLVIPSDLRTTLADLLPQSLEPREALQPEVYVLDISLTDIEPRIWRRMTVPANIKLSHLHAALVAAMGWDGRHLYEFETSKGNYGNPDVDLGTKNASRRRLNEVVRLVGDTLIYLYDFGDSWEHVIRVQAIRPLDDGEVVPSLEDGARACPPEDIGGIPGYYSLLHAISHPTDQASSELLEWVGEGWSPETFSKTKHESAVQAIARKAHWNLP